jgi:hypothetical protein
MKYLLIVSALTLLLCSCGDLNYDEERVEEYCREVGGTLTYVELLPGVFKLRCTPPTIIYKEDSEGD